MEKESQDRARDQLIKQYETFAFEALANYEYFGKRLAPIQAGIKDAQNIITNHTSIIDLIKHSSDHHTKENREKVKALEKDIEQHNVRIKTMRELGEKIEKEQVIPWMQRGGQYIEQIAFFKTFKVKTPEQIEADKIKPDIEQTKP